MHCMYIYIYIIFFLVLLKLPFGLCFSAAVILAPKHMEKGPSDNMFVSMIFFFIIISIINLMLSTYLMMLLYPLMQFE